MIKNKLGFSLVLILSLSGCSFLGGSDAELKSWIQQIKDKPSKDLPEIPGAPEYDRFVYSAQQLRDPFQPYRAARPQDLNQVRPDSLRNKEPLEEFTLDSLSMVGNINGQALILDPNGVTHRVGVGRYMGKSDGRIARVVDGKVFLVELASDGMGGWEEKEAIINLKE